MHLRLRDLPVSLLHMMPQNTVAHRTSHQEIDCMSKGFQCNVIPFAFQIPMLKENCGFCSCRGLRFVVFIASLHCLLVAGEIYHDTSHDTRRSQCQNNKASPNFGLTVFHNLYFTSFIYSSRRRRAIVPNPHSLLLSASAGQQPGGGVVVVSTASSRGRQETTSRDQSCSLIDDSFIVGIWDRVSGVVSHDSVIAARTLLVLPVPSRPEPHFISAELLEVPLTTL